MALKRYSEEDILKLLREIEVHIHGGTDVVSACRKAGVSDKTYCLAPIFCATNFRFIY